MKQNNSFLILIFIVLLSSCVGFDEIFELNNSPKVKPRIVLEGASNAVMVDSNLQLQATYFDSLRNMIEVDFVWTSSKPEIASTNQNGLVTGLQVGSSGIAVSFGDIVSDTFYVNVIDDELDLAQIEILADPLTNNLQLNEEIQFSARGLTINNETIEGLTFTWKSSNENVVSIDENTGLATAVGKGEAVIRVESEEVVSNGYPLLVTSPLTGTFVTSPGAASYNIGGMIDVVQVGENVELRFRDNFTVRSAPGPYAYLSNVNHAIGGAVEAGKLPTVTNPITGPFTITVAGVIATDYKYVVVYCKPFSIPFGSAELK